MGVPIIVVATKSDKLKANEIEPAMKNIRAGLGLPEGQPLRVSGVTGEGVKELWQIILDACETRVSELKKAIEEGKDDGGALRILSGDEEGSDDFYDDEFGEEEDDEYFEDGEDIVYDQGYDWIQQESIENSQGSDNFYDDEDAFIDDDEEEFDAEEDNWDYQNEKEFMKLKNLNKVVDEKLRRGEL